MTDDLPTIGTPDAVIVGRSLDDPSAFAAIFDRHWPRLHRYCVSRVGPPGEDVAAETFRVAFDERARFDPERADVLPWLYGIATNLLRRQLRGMARARRAVSRLDATDRGSADHADASLDRVEAEVLGATLAAALHGLGARDRDALLLYAWADLTYEQIAGALDVPVGTVRSRIHRARIRVRAHVAIAQEATS